MFEYYVKYLGEGGLQLQQVWMVRSMLNGSMCTSFWIDSNSSIETIFDKEVDKDYVCYRNIFGGNKHANKVCCIGELQKFDGTQEDVLLQKNIVKCLEELEGEEKIVLGQLSIFHMLKNMVSLVILPGIVKGKHMCVVSKFKMDPSIIIAVCGHKKTSS